MMIFGLWSNRMGIVRAKVGVRCTDLERHVIYHLNRSSQAVSSLCKRAAKAGSRRCQRYRIDPIPLKKSRIAPPRDRALSTGWKIIIAAFTQSHYRRFLLLFVQLHSSICLVTPDLLLLSSAVHAQNMNDPSSTHLERWQPESESQQDLEYVM